MSAQNVSLSTKDNGKPTGQRLWPLTDKEATIPDGAILPPAQEVLIIALRKSDMTQTPATFASFDRANHRHACVEALLQLGLASVCRTRQNLFDTKKESQVHDELALSVYTEQVYEKPPHELNEPIDYDRTQKQLLAEHLEEVYGPERADVERLMNGARSESASALLGSADTSDMRFMQGHDHKEVGELRLWIFMREKSASVLQSMCHILEDVKQLHQDNVGAGYVSVANDEKQQKTRKRSHTQTSKLDGNTFMLSLDEDELYRSFYDEGRWTEALAQYTQNEELRSGKNIALSYSTKDPIANEKNPTNPKHVFTAESYFAAQGRAARLDPVQCNYANYRAEGNSWKFPYPNSVLIVPPMLWEVARFRQLYTPQYQKLRVEPRLNRLLDMHDGQERITHLDEAMRGTGGASGVADGMQSAGAALSQQLQTQYDAHRVILDALAEQSDEVLSVNEGLGTVTMGTTNSDVFGETRPRNRRRHGTDVEDIDDGSEAVAAAEIAEVGRRIAEAAANVANGVPPAPKGFLKPNLLVGVMTQSDQVNDGTQAADVSGGANKTEIHTLRALYGLGMAQQIALLPDASERSRETRLMQFRGLEEYKAKCMLGSSNISQPGRAINSWMAMAANNSLGLKPQGTKQPFFIDNELSLFGASMVREVQQYDSYLFIHTTHLEMFQLRMAVHSAYMFEYDKLRLNILLFGGPATSKSYPIVVTSSLMITHTSTRLTNQSDLADADDQDHHDEVLFYEEMPDDMISIKTRKPDIVNQLKDTLTRNMVTRARLLRDDSGKHNRHVSISEKFVVYIVASNLTHEQINQAMFERFVARQHVRQERRDRSLIDQQNAAASVAQDRELKLAVTAFGHEWRFVQALNYHTFKLIGVQLMHKPLCVCFSLIFPHYKLILQERFAITIRPRIGEQIAVFLECAIVFQALVWLYHSPTSPFYHSERFSIWHLIAADPMLKDTEELVYFALDYFKSSFINPNQQAVIGVLRQIIVPQFIADTVAKGGDIYDAFRVVQVGKTRGGGAAATSRETLNFALAGQSAPMATDDPASDAPAANTTADAAVDDVDDARFASDREFNYNYFSFKRTRRKFCDIIAQNLAFHEWSRRLHTDEVDEVIKDLLNCKIFSGSYIQNPDAAHPPVVLDELTRETKCAALRISADGSTIYVHASLLFGADVDPHEIAIRACMTSRTPVTKYICGKPVNEDLPHLVGVRQAHPNNYSPLVDRLPHLDADGMALQAQVVVRARARATMSKDDAVRAKYGALFGTFGHKQLLDMSYDDYCTVMRLVQIGMPVHTGNVMNFSLLRSSMVARAQPGMLDEVDVDYPAQIVAMIESDMLQTKKMSRTLCQYGVADLRAASGGSAASAIAEIAPCSFDTIRRPKSRNARFDTLMAVDRAITAKVVADHCNVLGFAEQKQAEVDNRTNALRDRVRDKAEQVARAKAASDAAAARQKSTDSVSMTSSLFSKVVHATDNAAAPAAPSQAPSRSAIVSSLSNLPQPSGRARERVLRDDSNAPGLDGDDITGSSSMVPVTANLTTLNFEDI